MDKGQYQYLWEAAEEVIAANDAEIAALTKERNDFDQALQERVNRHSSEIDIAMRQIAALREALTAIVLIGSFVEFKSPDERYGALSISTVGPIARKAIDGWFTQRVAALEMSGGVDHGRKFIP